jgi:uncharacterized protein YraI
MKEVSNSARSIVAVLLRSVVWAAVFVIAIGFPAGTVIAQAQSCGNAPLSRLSPGMTAMIIDTTSLSMLDAPDESGNVIATLPRGSVVAVIEGAVCYEGQRMWRVEYGGQLGWITENAQQSYVLQPFGNDSVIAPPPLPTNPAPGLRGSGPVSYSGIAFRSPVELGVSISAQTTSVPNAPVGRILTFEDVQRGVLPARLHVWRVDEYRQYGIHAEQNIALLERLIGDDQTQNGRQPAGSVPFLPQITGGMTFAVQVRELAFVNGRGVRYITHFNTATDLVRPYSYLYTYQGLSQDGTYYVSITIPLTSELPEHGLIDVTRAGVYDQYIDGIARDLDTFNAAQFTPSLTALDQMVQSLQVGDVGIDLPLDGTLQSRLTVGSRARVTPGSANNVRAEPTIRAARIGSLPAGSVFTVVGASVQADGYIWQPINYAGRMGWTVETDGFVYFVEPIQ